MALKDYEAMQERCSNCSYCKWIPFDKVKSTRFAENCPSVCYNNFNTYSARGRFQLGLAVAKEEMDYSGRTAEIVRDCLSCGACDVSCKICRYNLEPLEHNIALKEDAVEKGYVTKEQKSMIESLRAEKTLIAGKSKKDRKNWAEGLGIKNAAQETAEVLFFPGCKYCYDEKLAVKARFLVKLFTELGADLGYLMQEDNCCAGRAWQMGFKDEFEKAADINIRNIKNSGAKLIITPCSDCYHALKRLYAERGLDIKVLHAVEYLDELISEGKLSFNNKVDLTVTYHDPCHLGRQGEPYVEWDGKEKKILNQIHTWEPRRPRYNGAHGVYDAPRRVLESIPGVKLCEMERIREYSWCCGSGGGCSETSPDFSGWTASERITEAQSTGAQVLVTACPWCETSLASAAGENGEKMQVLDIIDLVMKAAGEV